MFELMNAFHNDIDGSYCYGMLQYIRMEYGSRGEICTYRCSQCGMLIRNLEGVRPPMPAAYGGGRRPGPAYGHEAGMGFGGGYGDYGNYGDYDGYDDGYRGYGGGYESDFCQEGFW